MLKIRIVDCDELWVAELSTPYGIIELLCGEEEQPDIRTLILIEHFFSGGDDHLAVIRRSVFRFPIIWHPIRLAINDQGRLGVQFRNRITGSQVGMFFADEHSTFTMLRTDVAISDDDVKRLQFGGDIF
jgi:hypothetical protein